MLSENEELKADVKDLLSVMCDVESILETINEVIDNNAGEMRPITVRGLGRMLTEAIEWIDSALPPSAETA